MITKNNLLIEYIRDGGSQGPNLEEWVYGEGAELDWLKEYNEWVEEQLLFIRNAMQLDEAAIASMRASEYRLADVRKLLKKLNR